MYVVGEGRMFLRGTVDKIFGVVIDALTPVNWAAVTAFATIIAAGVAISALAVQVRGLRQSLGSSTYQNLVQQFNDYQRLLMDRPDLYRFIYRRPRSGKVVVRNAPRARRLLRFWRSFQLVDSTDILDNGLAGPDIQEINWALGILFNWYENAAIQTDRYKVIPADVAQHWQNMLRHELRSSVVRDYWFTHGDHFHPLLGEWVRRVLVE